MKLGFLFPPLVSGNRPLDWSVLETSPRGLTGTDNSFVGYARAMAKRGHDVHAFVVGAELAHHDVVVHPYEDRSGADIFSFDAVLSWCDPSPLEQVPDSCVRLVNCQLNDFDFMKGKPHAYVDIYTAPSRSLADRLSSMTPEVASRWQVLPNGVDMSAYGGAPKVDGRCIYASSPDRGLHHVLSEWEKIRARVPHATLRIFYHSMAHWFELIPEYTVSPDWRNREHARRAIIVRSKLELPGVTFVGSVSRKEMAREYSEAMVLAYPTDTITYAEGFAVSIMEGCASGALPIISGVDAMGSIYKGSVPMVAAPTADHVPEWSDMVIRALTDKPWRAEWEKKARALAERHDWSVLAYRLEWMLLQARDR